MFYKDRAASQSISLSGEPNAVAPTTIVLDEEISLRKTALQAKTEKVVKPVAVPIPTPPGALFAEVEKIKDDTLLKIREDIGDCTRCKLHKGRNKIVFGDGNPKARLVFVGEAPGADEDRKGIPFVGRAGKLLTQMIEAMGLQRQDVYICNVVKCRPPENSKPEDDEVSTCSPYLLL